MWPGGQKCAFRTSHKATRLTIAHFWLVFVQAWLSFVIARKQPIILDALVRPCLMALFADSTRCVEDIPSVRAPGCTCDAHFSYRLRRIKSQRDTIVNGLSYAVLNTECSYYCTSRRYERDTAVCLQNRYSRACCSTAEVLNEYPTRIPMPELPVPDSSMNPLPPAWACPHIDYLLSLLPYRLHGRTPFRTLYGSRLGRDQPHPPPPNRSCSYCFFPNNSYFRPTCSLTRRYGRSCTHSPCRPKVTTQGNPA